MGRPEPSDPMSIGLYWASRVTTVGLEFALPALGGLWLDRHWPLGPAGVIVGAAIGFAVGMLHLLKISRDGGKDGRPKTPG